MTPQRLRLLGGVVVLVLTAVLLGLSLRSSDSRSVPGDSSSPTAAVQGTADPCISRTCATVRVDFSGSGSNRANVSATCNIPAGATAWDCIRQAVGAENIQTQDFGGALGIFIAGLFGVVPNFGACGCFWEFAVNGAASEVGVSTYIVRSGDRLEWRIGQ
jgi:Domain of unknown function (DUF4430)